MLPDPGSFDASPCANSMAVEIPVSASQNASCAKLSVALNEDPVVADRSAPVVNTMQAVSMTSTAGKTEPFGARTLIFLDVSALIAAIGRRSIAQPNRSFDRRASVLVVEASWSG